VRLADRVGLVLGSLVPARADSLDLGRGRVLLRPCHDLRGGYRDGGPSFTVETVNRLVSSHAAVDAATKGWTVVASLDLDCRGGPLRGNFQPCDHVSRLGVAT
jgi:hypothetical protein